MTKKTQKPSIKTKPIPFNNKKSSLLTFLILFGLPVLLYVQTLSFGLSHFDDTTLITNNLPFLNDLDNVPSAFTSPAFNSKDSHFYRPIQTVSYMLDIKLSGGDNSWMYHLSNVLLLGLISCMLFLFLRKFLIPYKLALISSLVYVAHPLFTSSIAWIPARGDLQLLLFSLISFILFIEYLQQKKTLYLLGHWVAFTIALFCKETALALPILFCLYYFIFTYTKPTEKKLFLLFPLYGISGLAWGWLHTKAIGNQEDVFGVLSKGDDVGILSILRNLQTIPESLVNFFIPFDIDLIPSFSLLKTIIGIVLLLLIAMLFKNNKERSAKEKLFGLAWFILLLLPTMLFKHNLIDYLHHRFFLPMIGVLLFLLFIIPAKWMIKENIKNPWILLVVFIILSLTSYVKTRPYSDPLNYYSTAVAQNPNSVFARYNLGVVTNNEGHLNDALVCFTKTIELKPNYAEAYNNRGLLYQKLGNLEGAISDFSKVLEIKPDFAQVYFNRAFVYSQKNSSEEAISDYTKAIELNPNYVKAYNNRGNIYNNQKNYDKAMSDFSKAIEIDPFYAESYNNLGTIYQNRGNYTTAIAKYSKAIELKPDYTDAYLNRGNIYHFQKEYEKAIADFSNIIFLKPDLAIIYNLRGNAYLNLKLSDKACADFKKAGELGLKEGKDNATTFCR